MVLSADDVVMEEGEEVPEVDTSGALSYGCDDGLEEEVGDAAVEVEGSPEEGSDDEEGTEKGGTGLDETLSRS